MLTDYRVRQREHLLQISRALTAQLDLDTLLGMILQAAAEMLSGQAGLVALRDEDARYVSRASIGIPASSLPLFAPLLGAPNPASLEQLNRAMSAIAVGGLPGRRHRRHWAPGRDHVFRACGSFSGNDEQVLQSFADQAAVAVRNAQLRSRRRRRLDAIIRPPATAC
jgi:GAF domain-containing protein